MHRIHLVSVHKTWFQMKPNQSVERTGRKRPSALPTLGDGKLRSFV